VMGTQSDRIASRINRLMKDRSTSDEVAQESEKVGE